MKINKNIPQSIIMILAVILLHHQIVVSHGAQKIVELSSAYIASRAIHVAATLQIADHLVAGACHIDQLAEKVHAHPTALYRLLRLLASHDVFHEDDARNFSLTPLSQFLVRTHPESLQPWLANHDADEKRWRSYGYLQYSVQTGKPAFNHIFGQGYFDFIAQDSDIAASFDEGMRNLSEKEEAAIAACYDFSGYSIITDIGGGKGGLLTTIVKLNSLVQGCLYDLPHVQVSAQSYLAAQNIEEKISFMPGSFFDQIPVGADLYILKRILHDWDDELCIKILVNCRNAMTKNSKLLIIEAIVADGNCPDFAKDIDLAMLVLFGGKERTQFEWDLLLKAANLKVNKIYRTPTMLSILEVILAD